MKCPNCSAEADDEARFCAYCGTKLDEAVPEPEAHEGPVAEAAAEPQPEPEPKPVTLPTAVPVAARPAGQSGPSNGVLIGVLVAMVVIVGLLAVYVLRAHKPSQGAGEVANQVASQPAGETTAPAETPAATPEKGAGEEGAAPAEGQTPAAGETPAEAGTPEAAAPAEEPAAKPEPPPVPLHDPVAEATVVLERYLAADLGHDGKEMQKYLGGQALARFVPEVQGQEDVTVSSERIAAHKVIDANTLRFGVKVKWSPAGSRKVKTQMDTYVVRRTEKGWRVTSTPAYQEGD